ncbi:MAG TPA: CapA family protein [Sedimentibacter sp.]|jgi:poly-gamma-glutamate synthesis protein (capsule biosynthesis protein)|nr:CapA family protein [Sedimentibacter sp.]NLA14038.1 CapA family protein [Tissierellia bacterium]HOA20172.1 CapA family protein [Sedimentibacter sp.]HOG62793.1 CapA family protein [Sedimentibacter sp.]HOT22081.1 CapA family protein [Sedimentibacter sp.]
MNRKVRRRKKRIKLMSWSLVLLVGVLAASFVVRGIGKDGKKDKQPLEEHPEEQIGEEASNEVKEPQPEPDVTVRIRATGDIMFHPSQLDGAYDYKTNTYNFEHSFKAIKSIIREADIAIANFEGTTAGNEVYAYQGYPLFNAPDEALDAIKNAGFDILSTANNHSLDTRKAGIIRTIEQIKARGMEPIGTFTSKPETRVLIKDVKGIRFAFMAYTEMVNGLETVLTPEDLDVMVNIIDEEKMKEDIIYAKDNNADVIIAYLHWGDEYSRIQAQRQEILADMLFRSGVDIILGSHPHVIQPTQTLDYDGKTKFIAYSMGNFLSNQRVETLVPYGMSEQVSKYTEDGIIIDIEIEKKGSTKEISIKNINYIPLWVYKGVKENGTAEHIVYPIMDYIESAELDEDSKARMSRSYADTMAQMNAE